MNKTSYFTLWGGLFILCAGLGFIPAPTGFLRVLMICLSITFFIPPAMLLNNARKEGDHSTISLIRNLSLVSLVLTLVVLVCNFLSVMGSEGLGNFLYVVLVIVSTPMICGQYWVLGLFLWACLLMTSFSLRPRKKKKK